MNAPKATGTLLADDFPGELNIGLIAAVGTPIDAATILVKETLGEFGYEAHILHVSEYSTRFNLRTPPPPANATISQRIAAMMDRGNEARRITGCNEILALAAIADIRVRRGGDNRASPETAYVIRQLKHPEEVYLLRQTYGDGFFAIGFHSPRSQRVSYLRRNGARPEEIVKLIDRDEHEGSDSGQRFRDTFHMADAFVRIGSDVEACKAELQRLFSLIFGTRIITPRREEFGMFQAFGAALRSSQMGRQVGAAILSDLGDVLSVGSNEVPRARGGSYWEGESPDHRDHHRGRDANDERKHRLAEEILAKLAEAGLIDIDRSNVNRIEEARTVLFRSRLGSLVEFGRAVHAEADAIASASRIGVSTRETDLFCTTYPCHLCAKQIIAAGIRTVTYIEPYPKSLAVDLHDDAIALEGEHDDRVRFLPFAGVAPRRYLQLFAARTADGREIERKDAGGTVKEGVFHPRLRMPYFSALEREKLHAERLEQFHTRGTEGS